MRLLHRDEHGDTIVEVMIVLAILGLAIGISFATANRSLNATTQAQQASQATTVLQAQIEDLRSLAGYTGNDATENIYTTSPYCLVANDGSVVVTPVPAAPAANPCANLQNIYTVSISYDGSSTFTASATWNDLGGPDLDHAVLYYRIHKIEN